MKPVFVVGSFCAAVWLPGCTTMPSVAPLPQVVAGYCALPVTDRAINRAVINSLLLPNSVAITCAGDSVR
jgi:hypothetical protein